MAAPPRAVWTQTDLASRIVAVPNADQSPPPVENEPYRTAMGRMVRALGRRVGDGRPEDLALLVELQVDVDLALRDAVRALRAEPHAVSWSVIADCLGVTRQAAMARWPDAGGARRPGGQPGRLR